MRGPLRRLSPRPSGRIRLLLPSPVVWPLMVCLTCLLASQVRIAAADPDALTRKSQEQQQAADLAGALVEGILDVQLRQLRENGLHERPLYADIQAMRGQLDVILREDMREVVQLLQTARQAPREARPAHVEAARARIREIVATLTAQRRKLRRRLQLAQLAAQVREAVALQSRVRQASGRLADLPIDEQERRTLAAIEDQQDARIVHAELKATLEELSREDGEEAEAAAEGLQALGKAEVPERMAEAVDALRRAEYGPATDRQDEVLRAYRELLDRVERERGLGETVDASPLGSIAPMIDRQQRLREQTADPDLDPAQQDQLVDQQTELQQELHAMREAAPRDPDAERLLRSAAESAQQAASDLFEGKTEKAGAAQEQVIRDLAQLQSQTPTSSERPREGDSPTSTSPAQTAAAAAPSSSEENSASNPAGEDTGKTAGALPEASDAPPSGPSSAGRAASSDVAGAEPPDGSAAAGSRPGGAGSAEPWFARLPPAVREAIRSRVRQAPPRGYEERLRRYFESIE